MVSECACMSATYIKQQIVMKCGDVERFVSEI